MLARCCGGIVVVVCCAGGALAEGDVAALIKKVQQADHRQAVDAYQALFAVADLTALKRHEDDSIAIQAAWEEVRRTVPVEQGEAVYKVDRRALARFMGFFEARSRVTVPLDWDQAVRTAGAHRRDNIFPSDVRGDRQRSKVPLPIDAVVTGEGVLTLRQGEQSLVVPGALREMVQQSEHVAAVFEEKVCFVFTYDSVGYPGEVACVERKAGRVKWSSTVCGCWYWGGTGVSYNPVSVAVHEDRIAVFGRSVGAYAQGFDRVTGKTLFRFSSVY